MLDVEDVEGVACPVDDIIDMKGHGLFANFGFQKDGVRKVEQG